MIKKSLWRLACGVALALACSATRAGPWQSIATPVFRHVALPAGITPQAMLQDRDGMIWIGTQTGLIRWDGYQFQRDFGGLAKRDDLRAALVSALHEDDAGHLWIATWSNGVVRMDPRTGEVSTLAAYAQDSSAPPILSLAADRKGGLWLGTGHGLSRLDLATGQVASDPEHGVPLGLPEKGAVIALLLDRRGDLWTAMDEGLFVLRAGAAFFELVPLQAGDRPASDMTALMEDSVGRLWVATATSGVFVRDPATGAVRRLMDSEHGGKVLLALRPTVITDAGNGEIWMATQDGLVLIDAASLSTRRLRQDPGAAGSISSDLIYALFRDRSGLMWVGGSEALDSTNLTQRAVTAWYRSGPGPVGNKAKQVGTVLPRADGSVWLGSAAGAGGGVEIIMPDHAETRRLPTQMGRPRRALPDDAVLALTEAPDGQVFIGTNSNLYVANTDGSRVERLDEPDLQATSSDAMCVLDRTLWIGGKSGLRKLEITSPQRISGRVAHLDDPIHVLMCDSKDQILLGTSKGVFRFRPSTGALDQPWQGRAGHAGLPKLYVTSIARDHRGRMWVTLYGAGVCVVEPNPHGSQDLVRCMGHKEGVPDNAANAVAIDAKDNAWVSTDSGIVRVDGDTLATTLLQQPDGVGLMAHFSGSVGTTAQGDLLFGGKGLTIVHPEQFRRWHYKAPLVLTAVSEGQQPSGAIQLGPSIRSVQMSFALLDYSAPERVRYAYRLAGLEDAWTESPTESRIARYTNIPPGDYEFEVKAQNRVGDWTTAHWALRVEPAWYETAPARLAGGAAALLLLWSLIRLRMRLLELRAAQLRDEVAQRTQDLQQRTQQLESSRQALRELGAHNARALEDERKRVARELHDELGQQLAAMRMEVSVMKAHGDAGRSPSPSQWQTIRDGVDRLTASMRSLVTHLRPPALDGGLQAALEWLGTEYARATGTPCTVEVDDSERMLQPDAQTMVFRVAQESLNNVMRHARATQVSIHLQHSVDGCDLRVTDDGVGFDVANPRLGFGLLSMEERAQLVGGTLRVDSRPGDGTSVHLHVPADAVAGPTSP